MIDFDVKKYKVHPRILEVRFVLLFDMFVREYGELVATKFYESVASAFFCDMTKIKGLINQRFELKRMQKSKKIRWRQEVIFAAYCYDESIYKVAKDYLIMTPSNIYNQPALYDMNVFLTDEWLRQLDHEPILCGVPAYRTEVNRFFEAIDNLTTVLVRWKG